MAENIKLTGTLIGNPFMASVDRDGNRADKQNCAYIVSGYQVPTGYLAYVFDNSIPEEYIRNLAEYCPDASIIYGVSGLEDLCSFDIIEVNQNGQIFIPYHDQSIENILFITNKCNSNCIMCPDSDANRKRDLGNRIDYLNRLIDLIPSDTSHLTITGGEPTLLQWDFINLLQKCQNKFPCTEFLMLSNGRSLCVKEYRDAFLKTIPHNFRLAVPVYSTEAQKHDAIIRAPGGFAQTFNALKCLQDKIEIEIRIVIMKNNYRDLPCIAKFITEELSNVKTVSFMGMELLGNAARRRDELWVDYIKTAKFIQEAARILIDAGIDAQIYNYPLCGLPRNLWPIAVESISSYKIRYKPECDLCKVKSICGGFFFSTIHYDRVWVHPILEE